MLASGNFRSADPQAMPIGRPSDMDIRQRYRVRFDGKTVGHLAYDGHGTPAGWRVTGTGGSVETVAEFKRRMLAPSGNVGQGGRGSHDALPGYSVAAKVRNEEAALAAAHEGVRPAWQTRPAPNLAAMQATARQPLPSADLSKTDTRTLDPRRHYTASVGGNPVGELYLDTSGTSYGRQRWMIRPIGSGEVMPYSAFRAGHPALRERHRAEFAADLKSPRDARFSSDMSEVFLNGRHYVLPPATLAHAVQNLKPGRYQIGDDRRVQVHRNGGVAVTVPSPGLLGRLGGRRVVGDFDFSGRAPRYEPRDIDDRWRPRGVMSAAECDLADKYQRAAWQHATANFDMGHEPTKALADTIENRTKIRHAVLALRPGPDGRLSLTRNGEDIGKVALASHLGLRGYADLAVTAANGDAYQMVIYRTRTGFGAARKNPEVRAVVGRDAVPDRRNIPPRDFPDRRVA